MHFTYYSSYAGEQEDVAEGLKLGISVVASAFAFLHLHFWESVILKKEYLLIQQAFTECPLNAMPGVSCRLNGMSMICSLLKGFIDW